MESFLRLDMCVILVLCVIFCVNFGVYAVDNYGLLYASLRTFQAHACDGNELRLNCSQNTIISINFVRYGREAGRGDLCPGPRTYDAPTCRLDNALKVIEEKCQRQRLCRLLITPETFDSDPCPGIRKYSEVAYKCRPENFMNKIVCEDERMYLNCPEGESITIYAAFFGTTRAEVPECRQQEVLQTDDCQASYASEFLVRQCNGHQRCVLTANTATFGEMKCIGRKHLKVTYSCVDSYLLKRPFSSTEKPNEETIHTTSFPGWVRAFDPPLLNSLQKQPNEYALRTTLPSNTFRSEMQSDEVPLDAGNQRQLEGDQKVVGFMSEVMSAHKYMTGNKDKLILYVTLTMGLGILVFATVLIARFLVSHIQYKRDSKPEVIQIDDQFFSDSDLEHYDPPDDHLPPPIVNYTASLRRQSSDAQPRAPVTDGSELNHYFS